MSNTPAVTDWSEHTHATREGGHFLNVYANAALCGLRFNPPNGPQFRCESYANLVSLLSSLPESVLAEHGITREDS